MLGLAYFLAAALAVSLTRYGGGVAVIWIATAILLADLRYRSQASWWLRCAVCGIAGMAATAWLGLGPAAAFPLAIINIGEALAAAWLLRRFMPVASHLESPREIAILVLVPGCLVSIAGAFPGAAVAHLVADVPYWTNWLGWTTGHALGVLTVLPLAKLLLGGDVMEWARSAQRREWIEATAIAGVMIGTTVFVFCTPHLPLLFLPLLPMMVAVFRIGRLGATVSLGLLTVIGMAFTLAHAGPISRLSDDIGFELQFLQFYLVTAMLMALPAAAELKRRKKLLRRAEESAALFDLIAEHTGDIILAVEPDGSVRYASPSISSLQNIDADIVLGCRTEALALEDDGEVIVSVYREMLASPDHAATAEFRMVKADGTIGWFETQGRATVDESGCVTGAVSILREVSRRKARELDLARAASTDPLTGLLNRRAFDVALAHRLRLADIGNARGCIALFDLDYFKQVNDRHGHAAGDEVLKAFAMMLAGAVRDSDIVARIGGEEFVAFLADASVAQAEAICDRIRADLAAMIFLTRSETPLCATVSIGIAPIATDEGQEHAMQNADRALYEAKNSGRNRVALAA